MKPQLLGQTWHNCARCDRPWADSFLRINKHGLRICPDCWDLPNLGDLNSGD